MSQPFTLSTFPTLLSQGDSKGRLELVTFIATDGHSADKWTTVNTGTFAEDFAKIVSPPEATAILERLGRGETVLFPGFWALEELKRQFRRDG